MKEVSLIEVDYLRCARALKKNIINIILFTIICGILGGGITLAVLERKDKLKLEYDAVSSVYSRASAVYGQAADVIQYADLVKSMKVAERASFTLEDSALDKYTIYDMITAEYERSELYPTDSAVIYIHAMSLDPVKAVRVTNAVAEAFVVEVLLITQEQNVRVLDKALEANIVYKPEQEVLKYAGFAAAGGLALVCAFIVLREILALQLVMVTDASLNGSLEILGIIPQHKRA